MSLKEQLVNLKNNNPYLLFLWTLNRKRLGKKDIIKYNDLDAINRLYFNYSGIYPNLENPQTFSEKLQWLKLNYHNELMTICADKFEVRSYIEEKEYGHLLCNILGVYDDVNDLDISKLPNRFVLKATHGSGWNLIVEDKTKVNWIIWKKIMKIWLEDNIYWPGREWPYKNMKPRLIVEEFLQDDSGLLMDYKLFCFNGKVKFIQSNKGRNTQNHAQNFYDKNWKILPFGKDLIPRPDININPPIHLKEMLRIAEELSVEFPFLRVDFYEVGSKIVFGEFTFYPKSGLPDFTPIEYDEILGKYLDISKLITNA